VDTLTSLGWAVSKKRLKMGTVIQGITFRSEANFNYTEQTSKTDLNFCNSAKQYCTLLM
jgi:hypothetical protein